MPDSPPATMTIEQQHAAVLTCCDELVNAFHLDSPLEAVGQLRLRLAVLLSANLATEEQQLNAPLRRLAPSLRPRLFNELCDEAAGLRSRYSEHVGRWSPGAIDGDRAVYARASVDLVLQVKAHLARKRAVLADWRRALA